MKRMSLVYRFSILFMATLCLTNCSEEAISEKEFKDPSVEYWPKPLWFWNNTTVTEQGIEEQMQAYKDLCGYGGFGILPFGKDFKPVYLTEEYFKVYAKALERARELGLKMCLYDEYGFPSGGVGPVNGDGIPRFMNQFPEQTIKRLDRKELSVKGGASVKEPVPEGVLMAAVAMEKESLDRINLRENINNGILTWDVPGGNWKIMLFTCVKDGDPISDYLDPDAAKNFTRMTHDEYFARFEEYFGEVITGTFFDEPTMYRAQGRMWTESFNEKFMDKYSFNPELLYPALWYDIGSETQSARNYLFGFRSELYAEGFTKVVNDWSEHHGITATGHQDQEEIENPVSISGDLMKSFEFLEIPGIDKIGGNRPAERFYKIISSAAYNWDRNLVMSETYGAMGNLRWDSIYAIAMDQYARGINDLIPHAVWYDDQNVTFKPELSHRNTLYADSLKIFNMFLSRLNYILQKEGRHVADIAVLYPIHSLQGEHYFDGELGYYKGGVHIPHTDYVEVTDILTSYAGKDYTYIHPDVLDDKCTVSDGMLRLDNRINREEFKVLFIPSCKTISVENLRKVKAFYDGGGTVVFTSRLPSKSFEMGKDAEVSHIVNSIFPRREEQLPGIARNSKGGNAILIPSPSGEEIRNAIYQLDFVFDVDFPLTPDLRYIHKVVEGQDVYYFANIGRAHVDIPVTLSGTAGLEKWNPLNGHTEEVETETGKNQSQVETRIIQLELAPYQSCFLIGEQNQ
ncbi:MAG: hypothetical protein GY790_00065 [Bacteroidetes bacterium]|nr:hypothetical protein [Bacteroidota bacterium]